MPLKQSASPTALRVIRQAFQDLESVVTPSDAKQFASTSLQNVQDAALAIENTLAARQSLRNMRRLMPLFTGLEHYSKAVEVLCNGTPFLPWIWAPIKLVLTISSDFVDAFETVIKHYSRIAESLKKFEILRGALGNNAEFQHVLAVFYKDILRFHREAYKFVRRRSWVLFFNTSFGRFQGRFEDILVNLRAHEQLLDTTANAINIAETRQQRSHIEQEREVRLKEVEAQEKRKSVLQFEEIVAWLRVDQADQAIILDGITDQSSRYFGGCDWIMKIDAVRSWMQTSQDTPFLWLQGNPGTGKSVLAAHIIKFLMSSHPSVESHSPDKPHPLVVRHFCTYSYESSTRYDLILGSLLLQIIRENDDLIAYVHRLKETEFSKRAISPQALETLIHLVSGAASHSPGKMQFIHIVLDGLNECEEEKQGRLIRVLEQLTSSTTQSVSVRCKVLLLSRTSDFLTRRCRRSATVSLSEQKSHIGTAIKLYACFRFGSVRSRLLEMRVNDTDIQDMASTIAEKADGMFLWARLVLEYISKNMFYSKQEVLTAVQTLPRELSEFYRKILTQILANFDARSTGRLKAIFGWISFAKRPLKKVEFQSALAYSAGNISVAEVVPSYLFGMCIPLIEERRDSSFCFIHVSVKDYLEDEASGRILTTETVAYEHAVSTIACLLSGLEVFSPALSLDEQTERVLKGLHSFYVYSSDFWLDHLLSVAASQDGVHQSDPLHSLMSRLSSKLSQLELGTTITEGQPARPSPAIDAQLRYLQSFKGLHTTGRAILQSRLMKHTDENALDKGSAFTGLRGTLAAYQTILRSILSQPRQGYKSMSFEELERFKLSHRAFAFTCRQEGCVRATIGFETEQLREKHEASHMQSLCCETPGCQYPPFRSSRALAAHRRRDHPTTSQRKPMTNIRKQKAADNESLPLDFDLDFANRFSSRDVLYFATGDFGLSRQ